jgi:hypothetical protein
LAIHIHTGKVTLEDEFDVAARQRRLEVLSKNRYL